VTDPRALAQSPFEVVRDDDERGRAWFQELYRAEFAYVWNTLRRLGAARADLDDLVHEVFVVVFRRRLDFEVGRPVKPWLFGIAYRVAAGERRLLRHAAELAIGSAEIEALPAPAAGSPESDAIASERRELVLRGLAALDLDQRAVFVLHEIDGCSAPDIAAALDVKLNTVYSRLRLGREKFTAAVQRLRGRA
jgi:RNA polymerase sigma-70 factor (ECF subfamily)